MSVVRKGVVNNTTAQAQKRDVRVMTVLLHKSKKCPKG